MTQRAETRRVLLLVKEALGQMAEEINNLRIEIDAATTQAQDEENGDAASGPADSE